MKTLRCWNGRGFESRGDSLMVAAYSRREAAKLLAESEKRFRKSNYEISEREIGQWDRQLKTYFSDCWGNSMDGITPVLGVWYQKNDHSTPTKLL